MDIVVEQSITRTRKMFIQLTMVKCKINCAQV